MYTPIEREESAHGEMTMDDIVNEIFAQLRLTFGAEWDRKWASGQVSERGTDVGIDMAKMHWANELAGFNAQRYRLRYALRNAKRSTRPPNLAEFRALCNAAPPPPSPYVALPKPEERRVAREVIAQAGGSITRERADPLQWAREPRSAVAMAALVRGARADARLYGILAEHVKAEHRLVTNEARSVIAAGCTGTITQEERGDA